LQTAEPQALSKEEAVLIITRRAGERIMVGDDVVIEVMEMIGNSVRIGISAPRAVPVYREEIYTAVRDENQAAADAPASIELPQQTTLTRVCPRAPDGYGPG
jgi:carbon storage regulator